MKNIKYKHFVYSARLHFVVLHIEMLTGYTHVQNFSYQFFKNSLTNVDQRNVPYCTPSFLSFVEQSKIKNRVN